MQRTNEWYATRAAEINEKVKSMAEVVPVPGGIRANLHGHNISIFFWYKKMIFKFNYQSQSVKKFTYGQEADLIRDELIRVEKPRFTNDIKIPDGYEVQSPGIYVKPSQPVLVGYDASKNGTQDCIDHCQRKLEKMKNGLKDSIQKDRGGMLMLQTLINEFAQYL